MDERGALYSRLPVQLAEALRMLDSDAACMLEEIRVYTGGHVQLVIGGRTHMIPVRVKLNDLLLSLSAHALYSCETQLAEGYIPLPGGHRAGVCGRMKRQQDGSWRMADVLSVCIRIGRLIPDASHEIRPYLLDEAGMPCRVLLLGPPGCGKTTVLRDAALWLAQQGLHVGVADEREELFAANIDALPPGLDVLGGLDKAQAFSMLVRSMAPRVIVSDEIGHLADAQAVLDAVRCGVGLLLSAHAGTMEDALRRPTLWQIIREHAFDRCILLGRYGSVCGVYDGHGRKNTEWEEKTVGQLGYSRDGDDHHQCSRISACGR